MFTKMRSFLVLAVCISVVLCDLPKDAPKQPQAAVANSSAFGYKTGNIYKYDYSTCVHIYEEKGNSLGQFKADLYILPLSNDKWSVTMRNPQDRFAEGVAPNESCESFPFDTAFEKGSDSEEPFEISWKNGTVTALNVKQNEEEYKRVLIKTISSQFQLDLQGENCDKSKPCQLPSEAKLNAAYETMEKSTYGACATQYAVSPYSDMKPDEKEKLFKVVKTTDYKKCLPCSTSGVIESKADKYQSYKITSDVVASGNVKEHIIKSIKSTIKAEGFPSMVTEENFKLISTSPAVGNARKLSNPKIDNLDTFC